MRAKAFLTTATSALLLISLSSAPSNAAQKPQVVKGQFGESISAQARDITVDKNGQAQIVITGKGFDETVGIYLAYCLMPKAGAAPTPCGGGVNKSGIGDASYLDLFKCTTLCRKSGRTFPRRWQIYQERRGLGKNRQDRLPQK
jgi:hypothetical protein